MATNLRSAWPQVVGQAWADEEFRRRLLENPAQVLDELGVEIPEGHRVALLEDTQTQTYLVLPQKPAHLDALAAADGRSLRTPVRADACTQDPAFACTNDPAFACTSKPGPPKPFACTPQPKEDAPKPFACTPAAPTDACTPQPFACTNAPEK